MTCRFFVYGLGLGSSFSLRREIAESIHVGCFWKKDDKRRSDLSVETRVTLPKFPVIKFDMDFVHCGFQQVHLLHHAA